MRSRGQLSPIHEDRHGAYPYGWWEARNGWSLGINGGMD